MTVRAALIGCGAWGQNLLRVLAASPRARLVAVADPRPAARARAKFLAPEAELVGSLDEALAAGVDAVVIATPAHTHAALVLAALEAGVDVFVEKPLAMSAADAERCAARARALGRVGMVGHLLLHHPTVARLLELAQSGALGELLSVESARLSTAGDRSAPVLWTLGPHDLSVLFALDPSPPREIVTRAAASGDEAQLAITLESGRAARIALSRVHPTKERRITVIGSEAAAVFDDVRAPDRVLLGRVTRRRGRAAVTLTGERMVAWREPLAVEIDHFLACVEERKAPLTPLEDGVEVVRALGRAEQAARRAEGAEAGAAELPGWELLPVG